MEKEIKDKTVSYRLSNSKHEKTATIPKKATNIVGDGIYLKYDLPIGRFGKITHSIHLGYYGADVIVLSDNK